MGVLLTSRQGMPCRSPERHADTIQVRARFRRDGLMATWAPGGERRAIPVSGLGAGTIAFSGVNGEAGSPEQRRIGHEHAAKEEGIDAEGDGRPRD